MNIFGIQITRKKNLEDQAVTINTVKPIQDQIVATSDQPPNTKPISKISSVRSKAMSFIQTFARGRGNFVAGEYDLSEIGKVEDTDGFVRQSFKKKEGLMFKEGYGYSGANKKTARYISIRMSQIARASNIPVLDLLKRTARSLIRTSNAFLIKVRDPAKSGGRPRVTPDGKQLDPVAAYFPAAPETMRVDVDQETGKIRRWKQILPDGRFREHSPDNVVHFHIDRREGFLFGVPVMVPVIDDIRALRQLEENIELLLYQYLFPLFHYKVGTENAPAGYTEGNISEIDAVKREIELMPSEGMIVTPERHEINAIGAEGRSIRAESYLEHFKKRVFAGLGVSQVDMGDGDTTNRATAQTLSRALIDAVKDIQDSLEAQWDHEIISELLLESTFGDDVLEKDNMVHLSFNEIDIQNKMEQEEHAIKLFEGNAITHDELRSMLHREPILIPEDPQDQDLSKFPEWAQLHWKLFEEPLNLIRAVDEPYSVAAQMASESRSLGATEQQMQKAGQERERAAAQEAEQDRQTKVAVARARPVARKDHLLSSSFKDLETDLSVRLHSSLVSRARADFELLRSIGRTWSAAISAKVVALATAQFIKGFNDQTGFQASDAPTSINVGRQIIDNRIRFRIDRLAESTISLIRRRIDSIDGNVKLTQVKSNYIQEVHAAFDSTRFRADFIWDVELRKAYNFGRVLGMRFQNTAEVSHVALQDACERCKVNADIPASPFLLDIDDIAPHHPGCKCKLIINTNTASLTDRHGSNVPIRKEGSSAVEQENKSLEANTAVCPECGNTATYQPRSNTFFCSKCKKGFQLLADDEETGELDDAAKLERCVLSVKKSIRKKNPEMSEKEVKSRAFAICNSRIKKG